MACKRSGVRIPVAPQVRALIRNLSLRIAELYSSKVQQRRRMSSRTSVRIRSPHGASRRLVVPGHETYRAVDQQKRHNHSSAWRQVVRVTAATRREATDRFARVLASCARGKAASRGSWLLRRARVYVTRSVCRRGSMRRDQAGWLGGARAWPGSEPARRKLSWRGARRAAPGRAPCAAAHLGAAWARAALRPARGRRDDAPARAGSRRPGAGAAGPGPAAPASDRSVSRAAERQ
jgi:hypothetical protein